MAGVPPGCRAVPLVDVIEQNGTLREVRDRRQRLKTQAVVLVADPSHPVETVDEADRQFAVQTSQRRWSTVTNRYGDRAIEVALSLVRGRVVHLACRVDSHGRIGEPRWWQPTNEAVAIASTARRLASVTKERRDADRSALVASLEEAFPAMAAALRNARSPTSVQVLTAAANDLILGIEHAGPRAFTQAHFEGTKAHDVRAVLLAAGVPTSVLEQLGLRRGDRIGLGGPLIVSTSSGTIDLTPFRGPVTLRLDQPGLQIATSHPVAVIIENLQPAEVVCAQHPNLPVVYTAGQFGTDAAALLTQLASSGTRLIAIVDADLGGVRIARRILEAAPEAQLIDVGAWPHPQRQPFDPDGPTVLGLRSLCDDALVGGFATAILERGYPVEQEMATLQIVRAQAIECP